jgi:hypothetical protein
MNANELRIGNWVQIDNEQWSNLKGVKFQVASIEGYKSSLYNIRGIGFSQYNYNLEPIALTEEWLLEVGFISNPYEDRYEKGTIHIECDKTKGETYLWIENMPHIKYVHQLQNLYFALTGEELTKGDKK